MFTYPDFIEMILCLYDCESFEDFVQLWTAFISLHEHGLIDDACWYAFLNHAVDIEFDTELDRVVRLQ